MRLGEGFGEALGRLRQLLWMLWEALVRFWRPLGSLWEALWMLWEALGGAKIAQDGLRCDKMAPRWAQVGPPNFGKVDPLDLSRVWALNFAQVGTKLV